MWHLNNAVDHPLTKFRFAFYRKCSVRLANPPSLLVSQHCSPPPPPLRSSTPLNPRTNQWFAGRSESPSNLATLGRPTGIRGFDTTDIAPLGHWQTDTLFTMQAAQGV